MTGYFYDSLLYIDTDSLLFTFIHIQVNISGGEAKTGGGGRSSQGSPQLINVSNQFIIKLGNTFYSQEVVQLQIQDSSV